MDSYEVTYIDRNGDLQMDCVGAETTSEACRKACRLNDDMRKIVKVEMKPVDAEQHQNFHKLLALETK